MKKISNKSPVTLVELPPTEYGIFNGDLSSDVYSKLKMPSRSTPTLVAVLRADAWENVQAINPLYHGENGMLTEENQERILKSKVLGVSSITRTSPQSMKLIELYKSKNPNGIVIAGGMDPTYRTEEWLDAGADIIVRGEGERTIIELMDVIKDGYEPGHDSLDYIKGIAFKKGESIEITEERELLAPEELSKLPRPYYDSKTRAHVSVATMETSRGCPNNCNFCTVTKFFGGRYRRKSVEYVIEGLRDINEMGNTVFFTDDNFALSHRDTISLLEAITEQGLNRRLNSAQVTVKAAENEKLLKALERAGIYILYVGIESIFDESLDALRKPFSAETTKNAVRRFRDAGFLVHGLMILGGDEDTPEKLEQTLEWIKENLDTVQLSSPIPFPGAELSKTMQEQKRILTYDYSLYCTQQVVIRPDNFTPFELQETINRMYESFYSLEGRNISARHLPREKVIAGRYFYRLISEAIKDVLSSPQSQSHLNFLKSVS